MMLLSGAARKKINFDNPKATDTIPQSVVFTTQSDTVNSVKDYKEQFCFYYSASKLKI